MTNATPADGLASLIQNSERLLALQAKLPTAGLLQTPTPRDFTDFVAVAACFLIFNLLVIRFTAPAPDVLRRVNYAMRQFSMLCFTILARWGWMTLAVYYSPWAALSAWPLAIFETWSVQFNADVYEGRAIKGVTWRHASKARVPARASLPPRQPATAGSLAPPNQRLAVLVSLTPPTGLSASSCS